jgi:hypothetical protein
VCVWGGGGEPGVVSRQYHFLLKYVHEKERSNFAPQRWRSNCEEGHSVRLKEASAHEGGECVDLAISLSLSCYTS